MKKIIAVMPLWDDDKTSLWMLPGYLDGIHQEGGLPVIFPLLSDKAEILQLCSMCSGFLFTGGHDVSPELYGEKALPGLVQSCVPRDRMETIILRYAIKENKPLFGICRGIQFINAALGGTLYQDIPSQYPSFTEHHMAAPYDREYHRIEILNNTPLHDLIGKDNIGVNSYHHQAIKDLSPELSPMAVSEDGLIEAVYKKDHRFLWAVQWHPEFSFLNDSDSRKLFRVFVDQCGIQ